MPSWQVFASDFFLRTIASQAICMSLLLVSALAQQVPAEKRNTPEQQSGTSTAGAHAPVKDALSRPITAGGFVDGAPVVFVDITHAAGLDKFYHRSGGPEKRTILETPALAWRCSIMITTAGWIFIC